LCSQDAERKGAKRKRKESGLDEERYRWKKEE
jgi:hypothetical protein